MDLCCASFYIVACVFDVLKAGRVGLIGIGGKAEGSRMDIGAQSELVMLSFSYCSYQRRCSEVKWA